MPSLCRANGKFGWPSGSSFSKRLMRMLIKRDPMPTLVVPPKQLPQRCAELVIIISCSPRCWAQPRSPPSLGSSPQKHRGPRPCPACPLLKPVSSCKHRVPCSHSHPLPAPTALPCTGWRRARSEKDADAAGLGSVQQQSQGLRSHSQTKDPYGLHAPAAGHHRHCLPHCPAPTLPAHRGWVLLTSPSTPKGLPGSFGLPQSSKLG